MSYTAALSDLRQMIADTQYNKAATDKPLIGTINGANKTFVTFDKRIIASTFQAYVAGTAASSTVGDAIRGQITLSGSAPTNGQAVTASYYWTWWTDDELTQFINKGASLCGQGTDAGTTDYLTLDSGLRNGALQFAAHLATQALAMYLSARKHSGEFAAEQDGGDDEGYAKLMDGLNKMANDFYKRGTQLRDDFYKAQGRQYSPAFGIKVVGTRQYGPKR